MPFSTDTKARLSTLFPYALALGILLLLWILK